MTRFIESTETVKGNANALCAIASINAARLKLLHEKSAQSNDSLNLVASAAEELSTSIEKINQQVNRAAEVSHSAVTKAASATRIMEALSEGTGKINAVLSLITTITSQINLLALNATIEAARAGEQGKGFAVVAAEVKNLASKTAISTKEIAMFISDMSEQAKNAVDSIDEIHKIISTIDAISTEVAGAIVVQNRATQNIVQNINSSVLISSESKKIVDEVSSSTQKIDTSSEEMLWVSTTLSADSTNLNTASRYFVSLLKEA